MDLCYITMKENIWKVLEYLKICTFKYTKKPYLTPMTCSGKMGQSTIISTVLRALSSMLFWLNQVTSFPPEIRLVPVRDEPNEDGVVCKLQAFDRWMTGGAGVGLEGEEQWGKDAHCFLSDRKSVIHLQVESGTFDWESLS